VTNVKSESEVGKTRYGAALEIYANVPAACW